MSTPTHTPPQAPAPARPQAPSGPSFVERVGGFISGAVKTGFEFTKKALPFVFKAATVTIGAVVLTHGPHEVISRLSNPNTDRVTETANMITETVGISSTGPDGALFAKNLFLLAMGAMGLKFAQSKLPEIAGGGQGK
ncbi:MAG: hypothetical protein IT567_04650 [Alphaproteobacteria bacterium]|nr:hypothetical protein [Alphaproteobacteria bacterium]